MAKEPRLEESTEKIIVIDNIPKVGTDKKDKLKKILQNLLSTYGKITSEYHPEGENGVLHGSVHLFFFKLNIPVHFRLSVFLVYIHVYLY
jgi:hypothetical protein